MVIKTPLLSTSPDNRTRRRPVLQGSYRMTPGRHLTTPTLADALQGVELVSLLAEVDAPEAEDVLTMPLKDFAESKLLLEVYSPALQERVLFAGDRAHVDAERCRDRALYRGAELLELCGVDAPDLRVIHKAKKVIAWSLFLGPPPPPRGGARPPQS